MLNPQTDFEHSIVLLVKLLCAKLGIVDVSAPHAMNHKVFATIDENRTQFVRHFRKVKRRVLKLANASAPTLASMRRTRDIYAQNVVCYLVDVACMLVDGDLKRNTMNLPNARLYSVSVLRQHVNRTYKAWFEGDFTAMT